MIKAVLCDLGDTLINFHEIDVFKAFVQGARETYKYLTDELHLSVPSFGRYRRYQQWSIRWAYIKSKFTGKEFNSIDILKKSTLKLGIQVPEEHFEELAWRWYQPMAVQAKADPYAVEMLKDLQQRNLKLAIVSNTFVPPSALDRHLVQEDLFHFFPLRVYSCEVGVRKPNPKIFSVTLEKLQVEPQEALFIGDSPTADIRGARRMGMYAALKVIKQKRFHPDGKTFMVYSLDQIPQVVDKINNRNE